MFLLPLMERSASLDGDTFKAIGILYDYLNNIDENEEVVTAIAVNLLNAEELNDLEKTLQPLFDNWKGNLDLDFGGSMWKRKQGL